MRFPVFEHDAIPGVSAVVCRKSFAYCQSLVDSGTHQWLDPKRDGIQAIPLIVEETDDDKLSMDGSGSLSFADTVNNGTGAADKNRAALRLSGELEPAEIAAMQKVRNYYDRDENTGELLPSWADRIVMVDQVIPRTARVFA